MEEILEEKVEQHPHPFGVEKREEISSEHRFSTQLILKSMRDQ